MHCLHLLCAKYYWDKILKKTPRVKLEEIPENRTITVETLLQLYKNKYKER
jgi:hypothetical protein